VNQIGEVASFTINPPAVERDSQAISNRRDLERISRNSAALRGTYHLTADIDLSNAPWVPIGTEDAPFTGVLDGRGFVIRGMNITGEHTNAGLIGAAGRGAVIRNIGVEGNIDMFGNRNDEGTAGGTAGGIVGLGIVRRPTASSPRRGDDDDTHNFTRDGAELWPQILNCYANVNITLSSSLHTHSSGGIIGKYGAVINSYSLGNVTTRDGFAAGIGGRFTIAENTYNRGNITNTNGFAAGIVGQGELRPSGITAIDPFRVGFVYDSYNTGRIAGAAIPAIPANPAQGITVAIPARNLSGGIGGENVQIYQSFWTAEVATLPVMAFPTDTAALAEFAEKSDRVAANLMTNPLLLKPQTAPVTLYHDNFREWRFGERNNDVWIFPPNRIVNGGFPVLRSSVIFAEIMCDADECGITEWVAGGSPWSVWVTEIVRTCTVNGRDVRICTNCDTLEYRTLRSEGHDWSDWRVTTPPTCTARGVETRTCRVANCSGSGERAVAMIEHNWTDWRIVAATYTEDGSETRNCRGCDATEIKVLPALGIPCDACSRDGCCLCIEEEGCRYSRTRPRCERDLCLDCEQPFICGTCATCLAEPDPPCAICADAGCCLCSQDFACSYNRAIPRCKRDRCVICEQFFVCGRCEICLETPCEDCEKFPCACDEPTEEPTDEPTEDPTDKPTDKPTDEPTDEPNCKTCDKPDCDCPPLVFPTCKDPKDPCFNCTLESCGFLGGRYMFGRVTNSSIQPEIGDALAILRFVIGLSSPITTDADAHAAAIIANPGTRNNPDLEDALAILRFVIGLSSPLDDFWDRNDLIQTTT
jgi:hypothetical protein